MNGGADLVIETPEGVAFRLPLAGPITRLVAGLVDLVIVVALAVMATTGFGLLGMVSADFAQGLGIVTTFGLQLVYPMGMEWLWRGQTLGKRMFGLRVVDAEGLRLQASQVVVRNLLRAVDLLPLFYGVGGLAMVLSRRAQRLGDLAAGTVVIRPRPVRRPVWHDEGPEAGARDVLAAHPALAAELRRRVGPDLGAVMVEALNRREEFDPEARIRVFADIRAELDRLVHLPEDVVRGLSDEQWVRQVAAAIFRKRRVVRGQSPPLGRWAQPDEG